MGGRNGVGKVNSGRIQQMNMNMMLRQDGNIRENVSERGGMRRTVKK